MDIVNNDFMPAGSDLIADVQEAIDPTANQGKGYGLAPIDHVVTVVAPTSRSVKVTMNIETDGSIDATSLQTQVNSAVETYFESVRKAWANRGSVAAGYKVTIFISQLMFAVLQIKGVVNATNLMLDGKASDMLLTETSTTSELPVVGEVTING